MFNVSFHVEINMFLMMLCLDRILVSLVFNAFYDIQRCFFMAQLNDTW